jgi:hypothetical protein
MSRSNPVSHHGRGRHRDARIGRELHVILTRLRARARGKTSSEGARGVGAAARAVSGQGRARQHEEGSH